MAGTAWRNRGVNGQATTHTHLTGPAASRASVGIRRPGAARVLAVRVLAVRVLAVRVLAVRVQAARIRAALGRLALVLILTLARQSAPPAGISQVLGATRPAWVSPPPRQPGHPHRAGQAQAGPAQAGPEQGPAISSIRVFPGQRAIRPESRKRPD